MFGGENRVGVEHECFADCFFLGQLLFGKSERLSAITRAAVGRNCFVECKNTRRFGGCLFSVLEAALMIAGLDVVMRELLNCARERFAIALQALGNVTMQASTPDRI